MGFEEVSSNKTKSPHRERQEDTNQEAVCSRYLLGKGKSFFSSGVLLGMSTTLRQASCPGVVSWRKIDWLCDFIEFINVFVFCLFVHLFLLLLLSLFCLLGVVSFDYVLGGWVYFLKERERTCSYIGQWGGSGWSWERRKKTIKIYCMKNDKNKSEKKI